MNSGKVVLGFLAGTAVGAILGILFAPAAGTDTRKKIRKKGEDVTDGLKDRFNEFIEEATEKFEQAKERVSGIAGQARPNAGETKKS